MLQTVQDTRAALRNQINETLSKQCYPSISDIFSRLLNIRHDLDVTRGIISLALRPKRSWEFDFVAGGRVFGELYQRGVGFYFSDHLFYFFPPFEHKVYLRKTHASNLSSVWTLRNASRVCFHNRVFRPNREKKKQPLSRDVSVFSNEWKSAIWRCHRATSGLAAHYILAFSDGTILLIWKIDRCISMLQFIVPSFRETSRIES